jgi:ligand-binding sensor domain-containing protein
LKTANLTSWREADGLPSRTVRALYEDADGTLWIGSYDGGLAQIQGRKIYPLQYENGFAERRRVSDFRRRQPQFLDFVESRNLPRQKDELNDFADGKRNSITSIAYGKSDGMLNAECNGGRSPAGIAPRRTALVSDAGRRGGD